MGEVGHVPLYFQCVHLLNRFIQDQLIEIFKSVGQVVGFRCGASVIPSGIRTSLTSRSLFSRLVFDRDTGKPKGYGFCEFSGMFLVYGGQYTTSSD